MKAWFWDVGGTISEADMGDFEQAAEAYRAFAAGNTGKVFFVPNTPGR